MKKILLVEDEDVIADVLANTLEEAGYETVVARNGVEGWEKAHSFKPDLVLLDILIPGMDGWDLFAKFRNHGGCYCQTMKVVVLSNIGLSDEDKQKSVDLGAIDFWLKANFTPIEIVENIRKILGE